MIICMVVGVGGEDYSHYRELISTMYVMSFNNLIKNRQRL